MLRLLGMMLLEQDDEWTVGRRYFGERALGLLTPQLPVIEAADTAAK